MQIQNEKLDSNIIQKKYTYMNERETFIQHENPPQNNSLCNFEFPSAFIEKSARRCWIRFLFFICIDSAYYSSSSFVSFLLQS